MHATCAGGVRPRAADMNHDSPHRRPDLRLARILLRILLLEEGGAMRPSATAIPASNHVGRLERRQRRATAALRYGLGGLLAFAALNALAGGCYGLAGAEGIPKEW